MRILTGVAALIIGASSCGDDSVCVPPPCPQQIAVILTVTTSGGAAVPGLVVTGTSPSGPLTCQAQGPTPSSCFVFGSRGTYQINVSAPGFQSEQQTVQITSSGTHGCNTCDVPNTQNLTIKLAAAAPPA